MATKLSVYNDAALILKQRKIASLTEQTPTRITFDQAWDSVFEYMIGIGNWHFASRTVALTAEETAEPEFGYVYYFAKPDDYARLIWISASPHGLPQLTDYSEEGDYWTADCDTLYIKYVSSGVEHGGDLGKWTPEFTRATAFELADRTAGALTKASANDLERLERRKDKALHKAKSTEAFSQPTQMPAPGRLVQSRIGRDGDLRNRYR